MSNIKINFNGVLGLYDMYSWKFILYYFETIYS